MTTTSEQELVEALDRQTKQSLADLKRAGKKLALAQQRLDEAKAEARAVANTAHNVQIMEITITRLLGVDRMTVRRWLGKKK